MVNPWVLIATHKRLSITKKNIECLLKSDVYVILVVTDPDEERLFRQLFPLGVTIIQTANYPLGNKWQAGVEVARRCKADPLIINGSDDILSPKFFSRVSELLAEGYHFIGLKSWYVYDLKSVYLFDYMAPLPLGGGRAYSKELLEKMNYEVFDTRKEKHLDDLGWHKAFNSEMKQVILKEPLILSVKGDWPVMNPLNRMFQSTNAYLRDSIFDPKPILESFNYAG
jgi:hypothetical protein